MWFYISIVRFFLRLLAFLCLLFFLLSCLFDGAFVLNDIDIGTGVHESPYKRGSVGAYLINLERAKDRLEYVLPMVSAVHKDVHIISAIDGNMLTKNYIDLLTDYESYRAFLKKKPENGTIGCYLSHVKLWETFLQSGYEYALVFEDDISFDPKSLKKAITHLLHKSTLWDICSFEIHHRGGPMILSNLDTGLSLVNYKYRITHTGAYLMNRHAAKQLLLHKYPIKMPVDHFFTRTWELGIKFTGIEPRLVKQSFGDSYITNEIKTKDSSVMSTLSSLTYEAKSGLMRILDALKIYLHTSLNR